MHLAPAAGFGKTTKLHACGAAALLILVVLLRFGTFGHTVLDPDESVYLLIGQGILKGRIPYVEIWDHKPPGVYYLFAAALGLFGGSLLAIRLLACAAVWASSVLLVIFSRAAFRTAFVGYIAAIVYACFSMTNEGLATNTEILFTPFVIAGMTIVMLTAAETSPGRKSLLFAAGLAFGIALQIKYVVIFETALATAIVFGHLYRTRSSWLEAFTNAIVFAAGGVAPWICAVAVFLWAGAFREYWYANFVANAIHVNNTPWSWQAAALAAEVQLRANLLPWCAVVTSVVWLFTAPTTASGSKRRLIFLLLWLVASALGVCVTRRFYPHYSLQMLPALALITGFIAWQLVESIAASGWRHRVAPLLLMLLPGLVPIVADPLRESAQSALSLVRTRSLPLDEPARVARYLNERIDRESYLYVADYQPVLYYLVNARRPTRYLFPQFLTSRRFAMVAGIDPVRELDFIILRQRPAFVVTRKEPASGIVFREALEKHLARDYVVDRTFADAIVYRRQPGE
jgi:4-amino-4-deoxy-L-arabinose transferase-like glycosyltransferase